MYRTPDIQIGKLVGLSPSMRRTLARRLRTVARRLGIGPDRLATLGVRIVADAEMSKLHMKHMQLSGPTDVMSFPSGDESQLGDIALDWQQAQRQAQEASPDGWLDEATVLIVHGLVHLLGHDHAEPAQAREMHALERRGLRAVGVPDVRRPYGARR